MIPICFSEKDDLVFNVCFVFLTLTKIHSEILYHYNELCVAILQSRDDLVVCLVVQAHVIQVLQETVRKCWSRSNIEMTEYSRFPK